MNKLFLVLIVAGAVFGGAKYYQNNTKVNGNDQIEVKTGEKITSIIIPHFDFAKGERLKLLDQIYKKQGQRTAVLVSVNHFNSGSYNITTTSKDWSLAGGKIGGEKELSQDLAESNIAGDDETAFVNEHGITNILSDIYASKISDSILPIIIKDTASKVEVEKLSNWIFENCMGCYLISSVDFSHYCPRSLAQAHDTFSIQALTNLNIENIWQAETDSPQTLYLTALIAEKNQTTNFHLVYNANSGDPIEIDDREVTSVVLGYYSDKKISDSEKIEPQTTFVIAGDAMFDRNVWHNYKEMGQKKIFDNFGTRPFRGSDISLFNLEGPISASEIDDDYASGSMVFNFPPSVPSVLNYLNIKQVSLANNHTQNAGAIGFSHTKEVLNRANIKHFGLSNGINDDSILKIDGPIPVSILGIMTLSEFDNNLLESKIKDEKSAGRFVIVFPHWGEEYRATHTISQKNMAKTWISAGADAIIGSHPHVVADFEIINGKPVIYSLGNFVFDQFFSKETQEGLVVAGVISKNKIRLSFLPTKSKLSKPEFMTGLEKTAKIKSIFDIESGSGFKKISTDTIEITIN